jgi:hypothetical protein
MGQPPTPTLLSQFLQLDRQACDRSRHPVQASSGKKELKEATVNRRQAAIKSQASILIYRTGVKTRASRRCCRRSLPNQSDRDRRDCISLEIC